EHVDYDDLTAALNKIKETAVDMNEKKRDAESVRRVFEIETSLVGKTLPVSLRSRSLIQNLIEAQRRFVKESDLLVVSNKKKMIDRHVILFNDLLLVTKVLEPFSDLKDPSKK